MRIYIVDYVDDNINVAREESRWIALFQKAK